MATLHEPEFYGTNFKHPGMDGHRIFYPWTGQGEFGSLARRVGFGLGNFRLFVLWSLATQAMMTNPGADLWECGVWKGHSAKFLGGVAQNVASTVHLFDTFEGMPQTDPDKDFHREGNFSDTSLRDVQAFLAEYGSTVVFHQGVIPQTFVGMRDSTIAFAHIDVDIYHAVKDSLEFIYPRLLKGGTILFDDYGWHSCPGARQAVDEFVSGRRLLPLVLPTDQAILMKPTLG